jgi:hypothetical protein
VEGARAEISSDSYFCPRRVNQSIIGLISQSKSEVVIGRCYYGPLKPKGEFSIFFGFFYDFLRFPESRFRSFDHIILRADMEGSSIHPSFSPNPSLRSKDGVGETEVSDVVIQMRTPDAKQSGAEKGSEGLEGAEAGSRVDPLAGENANEKRTEGVPSSSHRQAQAEGESHAKREAEKTTGAKQLAPAIPNPNTTHIATSPSPQPSPPTPDTLPNTTKPLPVVPTPLPRGGSAAESAAERGTPEHSGAEAKGERAAGVDDPASSKPLPKAKRSQDWLKRHNHLLVMHGDP